MKKLHKYGFIHSDIDTIVLDLDETLAPTRTPISSDIALKILTILSLNVRVAIITMQSFDEVKVNVIKPLNLVSKGNSLNQAANIFFYCCGGAVGYSYGISKRNITKLYEINSVKDNSGILKSILSNIKRDAEVLDRGHSIHLHYFYKDRDDILDFLKRETCRLSIPVNVSSGIHILPRSINKAYAMTDFRKRIGVNPKKMLVIGDSFEDNGSDWGMYVSGAICISVGTTVNKKRKPLKHLRGKKSHLLTTDILKEFIEHLLAKKLLFSNLVYSRKWIRAVCEVTDVTEDQLMFSVACGDQQRFARFGLLSEEMCLLAKKSIKKFIGKHCFFLGHGASGFYEACKLFSKEDNIQLIKLDRFDIEEHSNTYVPKIGLADGILSILPEKIINHSLSADDRLFLLKKFHNLNFSERIVFDNEVRLMSGRDFVSLMNDKSLSISKFIHAVALAGVDRRLIDYDRLIKDVSIFDILMQYDGFFDHRNTEKIVNTAEIRLLSSELLPINAKSRIVESLKNILSDTTIRLNYWDINLEFIRLISDEYGLRDIITDFTHTSRDFIQYLLSKYGGMFESEDFLVVDDAYATGSSFISATIMIRLLAKNPTIKYSVLNLITSIRPKIVEDVLIDKNIMNKEVDVHEFSLLFRHMERIPVVRSTPRSRKQFCQLKIKMSKHLHMICKISPGRKDLPRSIDDYVMAYVLGNRSEIMTRFTLEYLFNDYYGELYRVDWRKRMKIHEIIDNISQILMKSKGIGRTIYGAVHEAQHIEAEAKKMLLERHKKFISDLYRISSTI